MLAFLDSASFEDGDLEIELLGRRDTTSILNFVNVVGVFAT